MTRLLADISLCLKERCPSRSVRLRYLSKPHLMQTYSVYYIPPGKDKCESYIPAFEDEESAR